MVVARRRLRDWIEWSGLSYARAARRLNISRSYLWRIVHGEGEQQRDPNLQLALRLQALTIDWPDGPIRPAEWMRDPDSSGVHVHPDLERKHEAASG